ncbi:tyrosine-type recombinase/integrase [Cobetia sp. L2A1]|uniref:tyrosine-type recombinase/integrase n=1 Tax=Cobetia sp. L2A1 TaxID=2686360 RepID=UPI00131C0815|nr:tyrosine-type recombinase/integrase [Cobetia sp. L2A1]
MGSNVRCVEVDFSEAKVEKVKRLGVVPQFFSDEATLLKAANQYMREKSRRLSPKSLRTEAEHLKEFLSWLFSTRMEFNEIDIDSFDYYVEALCLYKKSNGDGLSWNTVNARTTGVYRFLIWCYSKGHCPHLEPSDARLVSDSAKGIYKSRRHLSRAIQEPVKFLIMEDALKFISALGVISGRNRPQVKNRNILIGALMLQTGIRVSEVCTFPLSDLPEVQERLKLTPARCVGKGGKARVILIPNELLLKLWEYVDIDRESICEKIKKIFPDAISTSLFISTKGSILTPNWVQKLFRKAGQYSSINAHPHSLRHTFGTYHYLLNRDLQGLAKLMGHEDVQTTHEFYVDTATKVSYASTYSDWNKKIDTHLEEIDD